MIEDPKRALLAGLADIAKVIGHGRRLEILDLLEQSERSVERLAERTGLSVANTSQHLQLLRRAGLITSRRDGKYLFYRLSDGSVLDLIRSLRRVGERNSATVRDVIGSYFNAQDSLEAVSRKELLRRVKEGLVTVLDVRPEDEYAAGHVPGAINVPPGELSKRLRTLPRGIEIVAYCRGPYCVYAVEAVVLLRQKGFKARRLEDGFPEWRAAGLPVDSINLH